MLKYQDLYATNFSNFSFQHAVPCRTDCELYFRQICSTGPNLILSIVSYLDYEEILSLRSTCKSIHKKINKKLIKRYIRKNGLTDLSRKQFWLNNIDYKTMEELVRKELNYMKNENLYKIIITKASEELDNPDRIFLKTSNEIKKDLNRTFNDGKLKTEEGQEELKRVLLALAYIRPEIGYCQGMNFVAGALLYFAEDEELAFWLFLSLLDTMELNSLYFKVKQNF